MIYFLLGLAMGLIFHLHRWHRLDQQLNDILYNTLGISPLHSVAKIPQIKRGINSLQNELKHTKLQILTYNELIDNLPLGYLRIDANNRLVDCNKQARILLNINRWNPDFFRLFLELVRSYELDQLIQQTRLLQEKLTLEWQFFPELNSVLDGQDIEENSEVNPLSLKAYSFPLEGGEVALFIEDKTSLQKLLKRKEEFYSDLSHELRTPLTSMLLLSETLLNHTDERGKLWVKQLNREINRLAELVKNWLEIYQLENNPHSVLSFEIIDLEEVVKSSWHSLEILAQEKQICFDYFASEKIYLEADSNRLSQVFINLFDNSIKHCKTGGRIKVEAKVKESEKGEKQVEIDTIDTGSGFNPEDLPHVFERLYRGEKSRVRRERSGTGLGLSIVKQIISAHGGKIIAKNHPETKGAWIQIIIPMRQAKTKNKSNNCQD
ncbi:MAG: HAMP domain-containing sensor histidine kinase [Geminocystis sp.]|nr:HAMP domain-containing histidine kinase [Geminocystis sp.]MDW8462125.1 HAMP domain-containing sensor histidine kinase [Geminocystis sp.]